MADWQEGQEGPEGQEGQEGPDGQDQMPRRASAELKAILEALIFASPEPLTPKAIFKLLATEPKEDIQAALALLKQEYERPGGLQLVEVAGGYQIVTRPDLHDWVRRLFNERTTQKLTVQALETLAVIAYRQPITAAEITEVRGVNTSGVLNTLLERHLIKIVGRKQVVGRPFLYATTKEFLIRFGLNDLADLPKVEDMAEALGLDAPILVEQTPREEELPLSEPDPEEPGESIHEVDSRGDSELGVSAAALRRRSTSCGRSSRQRPTFSVESLIGPIATRLRCVTGWPTASHIFRTWRLRPSRIVTTSVASLASRAVRQQPDVGRSVRRPSMTSPRESRARSRSSGTPSTRASYTRATPWRGCVRRAARSPSLVRSSNPSDS